MKKEVEELEKAIVRTVDEHPGIGKGLLNRVVTEIGTCSDPVRLEDYRAGLAAAISKGSIISKEAGNDEHYYPKGYQG